MAIKTNDEPELLATVDMAVGDLKRANMGADVETIKSVIHNHSGCEANVEPEIFSNSHIARAIRRVSGVFATVEAS